MHACDRPRAGLLGGKLLDLARQCVRPGRDVTGSKADHDVARTRDLPDHFRKLAGPPERRHVAMAGALHEADQHVAIDAFDRRFARGIDIGDDHGIGVGEAA